MNKVLIPCSNVPRWPVRRTTLAGGRGNSEEIARGKGMVFVSIFSSEHLCEGGL